MGKGLWKSLPVLSGVSEKSYQKAFDIGKAEQIAKGKIKYLTDESELGKIKNIKNKLTGKGKSIEISTHNSYGQVGNNGRSSSGRFNVKGLSFGRKNVQSSLDDILKEETDRLARQAVKTDRIHASRKISPGYKLAESDGLSLEQKGYWQPTEDFKGALDAPLSFNEYTPSMNNANRFHKAMSDFKKTAGLTGEQVYQYSPK